MIKKCNKCGEILPIFKTGKCKGCFNIVARERRRKYIKDNPEKLQKYNKYRQSTIAGRATVLLNSAKTRAKKNKREISLTHENVKNMLSFGVCWVTGFKLDLNVEHATRKNPFGPSLDRRDNSKDYTPENTQIVATMVNDAKNEYDEIDFIAMCMAVAERNSNNQNAINRLNELRNARL